jgi:hypothetical protein
MVITEAWSLELKNGEMVVKGYKVSVRQENKF